MSNPFFDHPILNGPYAPPERHWELDEHGQPTQRIVERRRAADFITPIPKPKKRKGSATQKEIVFDEGKGLSTDSSSTIRNRSSMKLEGTSKAGEPCRILPSGR
jgi:type III restriction enzyme